MTKEKLYAHIFTIYSNHNIDRFSRILYYIIKHIILIRSFIEKIMNDFLKKHWEKNTKDNFYDNLFFNGFFSEYLPPCFELDKKVLCTFDDFLSKDYDVIQPCSFTMSRFNSNNSRRTIFIPEIVSYVSLNSYIRKKEIIEELIHFIDENSSSFSRIITEDGTLVKHDEEYVLYTTVGDKIQVQYIDNIVKKLLLSSGAKKILKLDIANCYSSFYTHNIPAIIMGYDKAQENYKKNIRRDMSDEKSDENYKKYNELDKMIRRQNKNQTNGLLVGPIISKIIVEGLLTRIDIELKDKGILFTRYVDDYEVFLFEDNEESIKNIFIAILKKYGFDLNYEKIETIDFPYYIVDNFDKIIELYRHGNVDDYSLVQLFNDFFRIEKAGAKGAIRYLLKSLDANPIDVKNKELFDSYIITIMSNDSRSLTKACSLLIGCSQEHNKLIDKHIKQIEDMIINNIKKNYDLEVIWLLYILIETENITKDGKIVEEILKSNNEIAKLMILRKGFTSYIDKIKQKAESWLLNYELFVADIIEIEELCKRIPIQHYKDMYIKFKEQNIHFCYLDKNEENSIHKNLL